MNLSRIIRAVTVASLIGVVGAAAVRAQEYIPAPTGQTELQYAADRFRPARRCAGLLLDRRAAEFPLCATTRR